MPPRLGASATAAEAPMLRPIANANFMAVRRLPMLLPFFQSDLRVMCGDLQRGLVGPFRKGTPLRPELDRTRPRPGEDIANGDNSQASNEHALRRAARAR